LLIVSIFHIGSLPSRFGFVYTFSARIFYHLATATFLRYTIPMKKLRTKLIVYLVLIVLAVAVLAYAAHQTNPQNTTATTPLGTWWWNKNLDADEYLTFAADNDVTEIYFCDYSCGDATANIVEKAHAKNITVYLLAGEKEWLNDRQGLDTVIANYQTFQNTHDIKLAGIHLDIEPHQFDDFQANRATYLLQLVTIINENKTNYPDIKFDYDIPFWLDDEITYNGATKPTYQHILDTADRTFIMSYRDTAAKMQSVAQDEIDYATANHKTLFLGAETYSEEGDQVSYYEEGKTYMAEQLAELRQALPDNFGIAIHQIKTWHDLQD